MRNNKRILGALVVAGLVATGGTAFTAAGTGVDDAYVSYDANTTSGVSVTNVAYNVDTLDASKLTNIVFTETEDVSTGYDAIMTINGPAGVTQITCTATYDVPSTTGTIDCPTTADVADVTSVSLTVTAS